jgi:hypothetical protein
VGLTELQQINAIIGLSKNIAGWPSTLADHRYSLDRIELKLTVPDPLRPGINLVINPDLLFVSDERNHSLIVELKSGSYQEHDLEQLEKVLTLTASQLVRSGRVTLQYAASVGTHQISVMLVVNENKLAGFKTALTATPKACLVSIGTSLIQTQLGALLDRLLDNEFRRGVVIAKKYLPTRLLRVLPTTNQTKDIKRCIVETIRDLWVNNERSVNPQRIADRLFSNGIWALFDSDAKKQFVRIAEDVLKDMRETEFNRYLQRMPGERHEYRLLRLPETEGRGLFRAQQTFQRAVREYKTRLLNDEDYRGRFIDQYTLDDIV